MNKKTDIREQLIRIIKDARYEQQCSLSNGISLPPVETPVIGEEFVEAFADYLIDRGVTLN